MGSLYTVAPMDILIPIHHKRQSCGYNNQRLKCVLHDLSINRFLKTPRPT